MCQWSRIFSSTFSAASNYPTRAPYSHINAGWLHCQGAQSQQSNERNDKINGLEPFLKSLVPQIVKKLFYFLYSSKFHFRVHKRPPLVPIPNSIPNIIPCFPKDHAMLSSHLRLGIPKILFLSRCTDLQRIFCRYVFLISLMIACTVSSTA